jgi:hypothetical protein
MEWERDGERVMQSEGERERESDRGRGEDNIILLSVENVPNYHPFAQKL